MTSLEWQLSTDALAMLNEMFPFRGMDSTESQSRKSRLYLIGCARRSWKQLPGVCQIITTLAERAFYPRITDVKLREEYYQHAESLIHCRGEADDVNEIGKNLVKLGYAKDVEVWAPQDLMPEVWQGYAQLAFSPFSVMTPNFKRIPAHLHSAELVHEVFSNPIAHLPPLDPTWRTENVVHLAQHIDSTGDFATMPVLADALEEAGCDRTDILDHLRRAEHIRGCWVLEEVIRPDDSLNVRNAPIAAISCRSRLRRPREL